MDVRVGVWERWAPKNWCFWTVVLEKTLESPLDCKEIQPVHPKGNQSWIFIGRTVAETPILWPLDVKNWLIGKDPDAGKDWRWEEKGTTEDEMVEGLTDSTDISLSKLQVLVMYREACRSVVHGVAKSWTRLSNWTELNFLKNKHCFRRREPYRIYKFLNKIFNLNLIFLLCQYQCLMIVMDRWFHKAFDIY